MLFARTDHLCTDLAQFKGSAKLYFVYYSRVVIILFSAGLYKSAFSIYSFNKTGFLSFCVWFFVFPCLWFLVFSFSVLCSEFNVILDYLT